METEEKEELFGYLLMLCAHRVDSVRQMTFTKLEQLSSEPINENDFWTNPEFVYQLVAFGLSDSKVSKSAQQVLELLSSSPNFTPLISRFHSLCHIRLFGTPQQGILEGRGGACASVWVMESARILFSSEASTRAAASRSLMMFVLHLLDDSQLSVEEREVLHARLQTSISELKEDCLTGLRAGAKHKDMYEVYKFFQANDVSNLLSVFTKRSLEISLRNASAAQLCSILDDRSYWHLLRSPNLFECVEVELSDFRLFRTAHDLNAISPSRATSDSKTIEEATISSSLGLLLLISKTNQLFEKTIPTEDCQWRLLKLAAPFLFHRTPQIRILALEVVALQAFHCPSLLADGEREEKFVEIERKSRMKGSNFASKDDAHSLHLRLPSTLVDLLDFPFEIEVFDHRSVHERTQVKTDDALKGLSKSDLYADNPEAIVHIQEMVDSALEFEFSNKLSRSDSEAQPPGLSLKRTVRSFLSNVRSASDHDSFLKVVSQWRCMIYTDSTLGQALLNETGIFDSFSRCIEVVPTSLNDDRVLIGTLAALGHTISTDSKCSLPS
eukprot:490573_1